MSKRILVTSTDLMMVQFLVPHVINLSENGFEVEIACSDVGGRMDEIRQKLEGHVGAVHTVRLVRSPASPTNLKGYGDMKKVIETGRYDVIWTNEPVMGVVTRLAARKARKRGTKVIYMVHGFHFFTGAPKANWMIYYPVEQFASRFCDEIVTINQEDYNRAKKMHAPAVGYIHGIGVNTDRLQKKENQSNIRRELGLKDDDFLLLSVGELNENKNHKVILRALGRLQDRKIHYIICGKGDQLNALQALAAEQKITENVHFLGYRTDVVDICSQADAFAFPSYREGLGLAALEAMYCGLPLITSNVRGPIDFMVPGETGAICPPDDIAAFAEAIQKLAADRELRVKYGERNRQVVQNYCLESVKKEVLELFKGFCQ